MSTVIAVNNAKGLSFVHNLNYESRGISVEKLIRNSIKHHNINHHFDLTVWTGDGPHQYFPSFSTINKNYANTFPCFVYDGWPECGLYDYDETCNSFQNTKPDCNKIGWIGYPGNIQVRAKFISDYANTYFSEAKSMDWTRDGGAELWKHTPTYMTYQSQIDCWKYLLDMEGCGWSARTKVLLRSPRIVFIVDRPYEEWWYEHLIPWKHYVPVKRDLSDLEENYITIENNESLQQYINVEQRKFAQTYLTNSAALTQIKLLCTAHS